ncbi:hypothetical protein GGR54DRAFT_645786 [Hypoxylon sp. NC1633]|nr:hypothetical protein GGR54DRAFT_645786 [Hypoxylon sp. NC1633]
MVIPQGNFRAMHRFVVDSFLGDRMFLFSTISFGPLSDMGPLMTLHTPKDGVARKWAPHTGSSIPFEEWVDVSPCRKDESELDARTNLFPVGGTDVRTNLFPVGDIDARSNIFPIGAPDARTNLFPVGNVDARSNLFPIGGADIRTNAFLWP